MNTHREGFTLVEVVVAMMILTIAVIGMAGSAAYILSQVRSAELRTQRTLAVREVTEQLYATEWTTLETACGGTGFASGRYQVACTVESATNQLKRVQIISTGPGYRAGTLVQDMQDTLAISVARPL